MSDFDFSRRSSRVFRAPWLAHAVSAVAAVLATYFLLQPLWSPARSTAADAAPAAQAKLSKPDKNRKLVNEFFLPTGPVPTFEFTFDKENWEYLGRDGRRYAEGEILLEDGKVLKNVAVKLKGSAGSFRDRNDRPGLTISMNKFKKAERWNGFSKWHLNNALQDGTTLMEFISGEIARAAGVPASRCSHAFVKWQGRDLGLYVFKEGFTSDFLARFFAETNGDLYDGGFVSDLKLDMEKDEGDAKNTANLKELMDACQEGDLQKRWARLEKILDIEAFISYLAMESILCHWDGYNFNRNNYRVYFNPATGKAHFILHGMDQTLGDANADINRQPTAMVGSAVMSNPAWKARYPERVKEIYETVLKSTDWSQRLNEAGEKVRAALEKRNPQAAKDYAAKVTDAKNRVEQRIAAIGKKLGDMPKKMKFEPNGSIKITSDGWRQEGTATQIDTPQHDGKPTLHIKAEGASTASWRKNLSVDPGKYRVEVLARTAGVEPAPSASGEGAGVRISGGNRNGQNAAKGDTGWDVLKFEFDAPGGDVILVAELRATKGEVWFDRESFRLVQLK